MFDFIEHVRDPDRRLDLGTAAIETRWHFIADDAARSAAFSWRLMGHQWFHYVRETSLVFLILNRSGALLLEKWL